MTLQNSLRLVMGLAMLLAGFAAVAGLFWEPGDAVDLPPELYGFGLYRRDTPFVAGASQGSDVMSLFLVGGCA